MSDKPHVPDVTFHESLDAPIADVLTRYGPLRIEVLTHLVNRDHRQLSRVAGEGDITFALDLNVSGVFMGFPTPSRADGVQDWCARLVSQVDAEPTLVASNNYVAAYCELVDIFRFVQAHPEVAGVPLNLLQDLYARQRLSA